MADFNKDQGDIQGVEPNTMAPRTDGGEPATGFSSAIDPMDEATEPGFGPGAGIPGNTSKIH